MHFLQGATSPTDTCEFAVKALMGGKFRFPEGTELVSAVYAVAFTDTLSDTVEIEIQHCVNLMNEEQGKYLSFVSTAKHDQLKFEFIKGGIFYPGKRYASIKGLHCTEIAIVERINPAPSEKETHHVTGNCNHCINIVYCSNSVSLANHYYTSQLYYERVGFNRWKAQFVIVRDVPIFMKVLF